MKNLYLICFIIVLLGFYKPFSNYAQTKQNLYVKELQQAFSNRTEDEKRITSDLFSQIFRYNKAISEGISRDEAMKYFNRKNNRVDSQNRLQIMVRFSPGMSSEAGKVNNLIVNSGGIKSEQVIGHNSCVEIYCWMPVEKIINIASNPGVGVIEPVYCPITR